MNAPALLLVLLVIWNLAKTGSSVSSGRRRLDDTAEPELEAELRYHPSQTWNVTRKFGQITAVALNARNNVVIFQRGSHAWDGRSFNDYYAYNGQDAGPIPEETVYELDQITGAELGKWGENFFYLPHGLSIDSEGNHWVTDVAMHQVFKFGPDGGPHPLLQMGEKFVPGSDFKHFCQPTSVAVHSGTKEIFVADGYCNSRLIKFSATGRFLMQWGDVGLYSRQRMAFEFQIPHKVVLIEDYDEACISDREHGKIKCLNIKKQKQLIRSIGKPEWNRLFSISFAKCASIDMFFAVNGPSLSLGEPDKPVLAFGLSYEERKIVTSMAPQGPGKKVATFNNPHDIVSSKDCKNVFVVEIGPNVVWKFMTNFFGPNPDHKNISLISRNVDVSDTQENTHKPFFGSFTFMISALSLVVIVIVLLLRSAKFPRHRFNINFLRRGMSSSRDSFDLGRLLDDPKKSGFNRVSTHEIDADIDGDQSDSEVEEFNVISVRNGLKV